MSPIGAMLARRATVTPDGVALRGAGREIGYRDLPGAVASTAAAIRQARCRRAA